jgi:uncharacterized protein YjbI with pentapeptide repeats
LRFVYLHGATLSYAQAAGLRASTWPAAYTFDYSKRSVHLEGANMFRMDLRGAQLVGADLRGADLRGASLRGADLRCTSLWRATLENSTDLSLSDLRESDWTPMSDKDRGELEQVLRHKSNKRDAVFQSLFASRERPAQPEFTPTIWSWSMTPVMTCGSDWPPEPRLY